MKFRVTCEKCQGTFTLTKDFLTVGTSVLAGEGITETFYTCPACGEKYVVLIDNEKTLADLAVMTELCEKIAGYIRKRKNPPEKLNEKMLRHKRKLQDGRDRLRKRYDRRDQTRDKNYLDNGEPAAEKLDVQEEEHHDQEVAETSLSNALLPAYGDDRGRGGTRPNARAELNAARDRLNARERSVLNAAAGYTDEF